ncbi:hypothetical protein ACS0PU_006511 [Formica fusca]
MPRRRSRYRRRPTLANTLRYDYFAQFNAARKEIQMHDIRLNGINRPCRLLGEAFTFTTTGHTRCPVIQLAIWGPEKKALTISVPSIIDVSPKRISQKFPRNPMVMVSNAKNNFVIVKKTSKSK